MVNVSNYQYRTRKRSIFRRMGKIILAPFYYIIYSGQAKSMLSGRAKDVDGNPIPMLTYPAFDFLLSVERHLESADILEFGCGQSTKWFAPRVRSLVGVERNDEFRLILEKEFLNQSHIRFMPASNPLKIEGRYDIILIDGKPRIEAAKISPDLLKDDGIIIVDNSDVQSIKLIPKFLYEKGFARIDFFGYSPTGIRKQGTSIFFKSQKWFRLEDQIFGISKNSFTESLS